MRSFLLYILLLFSLCASAQTFRGKVLSADGKALDAVSVILTDDKNNTVAFGFSEKDGSFEVKADGKAVQTINFSYIGYARKSIDAKDFKDGQTIELEAKTFQLKEVSVRPDKITQRGDTLTYSVNMFKQGQDRSIADVIRKMPGLEVSPSGQISFEGKPINKFYIEGMDLMSSKYTLASENLQADRVKNVQVVQNHQPVKSLQGVQFSEQAALNIVLKDDAKNAWTGLAEIGLGTPLQDDAKLLYDGRFMAMMFSKKQQNLSLYKANNSGKDIAHEVRGVTSLLHENNEQQPLLQNISVNTPDLDEEQVNFNTSHMIAVNHLIRTKSGNDLRIQADYLWNREQADMFMETKYTDLGGVILTEENSTTAIENRVKAELTYKINTEKLYLNNRLYGNMDYDKSFGYTMLNGKEHRQMVRPKKSYLTEYIEVMKTTKKGHSYTMSSNSTFSYLPGQLLTVLSNTERLNFKTFASNNVVSFRQRMKWFALNHKIGADILLQQMDIDYTGVNTRENFNKYDFFASSSLNMERNAVRLNLSLRANMSLRNYDHNTEFRFALQPRLTLKYDVSSTTSATVNYAYSEHSASLTEIYRTPIFTSYRSQTAHSGKTEDRGVHSTQLSFAYKQPIKGNFMSASASWYHRTNEMLFSSQLHDNVYLRMPTDHRYSADTYSLRGGASHSFYWGKTSIGIEASQIWSDYTLLLQDTMTDWRIISTNVNLRVAMQPVKQFSYELNSRVNTSRQHCLADESLTGKRITYFCHSFSAYAFPVKMWEIGLTTNMYHSTNKDIKSNLFTNVHISYKTKRAEYRLDCTNIFNNSKYEQQTISTTTEVYSVYTLHPREIMAKVVFDL